MSLALTVKEGMCLGEFEEKYKLLSHWINNEAVFRITLSSEWYVNNIEFKYMYQIGQTIFLYLNYSQQIYENGNTFTCYVYIHGQKLFLAENSEIHIFAMYLVWKCHFLLKNGMYHPGLGFQFGLTEKLGRWKEY